MPSRIYAIALGVKTMNTIQKQPVSEFIAELVEDLFIREVARIQKTSPDRLHLLTDDYILNAKQKYVATLEKFCDLWQDKAEVEATWRQCGFMTTNKAFRALLEYMYDITLPSSDSATDAFLREFIGYDVIERAERDRIAERERKEAYRRQQEDERQAKIRAAIIKNLRADEAIRGEDLVTLAKEYKIKMHPRTVGCIRKRVITIGPNQSRVTGKGGLPQSVWKINARVREIAQGNE